MDSAPGNVYGSDLSFMDPTNPFYPSSLANTSTNMLYPITAVGPVPSHLVPGVSFTAYSRPYQPVPLGIYDTGTNYHGDFNSLYQSCHRDYTTERIWDISSADQLLGPGFPLVTESDLGLESIGEDALPLPDIPALSLSNDTFDSWIRIASQMCGADACNSFMQELPMAPDTVWDVSNPFAPDAQRMARNLLEDVDSGTSNGLHVCQWRDDDGTPCNTFYPTCDDLKHAIAQHLNQKHRLRPSSAKTTQQCLWRGCAKELKRESIVRHILAVHLHVTTACQACGTSFARRDSLQRHMRNSCGACKGER